MNELILRSPSLDALMPEALEIAISLSQAERGFHLVAGWKRSIHRGEPRRGWESDSCAPHLEVSTTIAEEAARTGAAY
ncbi:MAG: hypothetical protein R3E66_03480 [bacterium]